MVHVPRTFEEVIQLHGGVCFLSQWNGGKGTFMVLCVGNVRIRATGGGKVGDLVLHIFV